MPMAVISTARLVACRSGLYASFSIVMPSAVQASIASRMQTTGGSFQYTEALKMMNAPTMITSPWAKFSILAIPYTIV